MKIKSPSMQRKGLIVLFLLTFFIILMALSGMTEFSSGTKIGYVSDKGTDHWSAKYISLDGTFSKTVRPDEGQDTLMVSVNTEEGKIRITIEKDDSNIIFDKDNITTDEFLLKINGKVNVRIEADRHKGSFDIRCE